MLGMEIIVVIQLYDIGRLVSKKKHVFLQGEGGGGLPCEHDRDVLRNFHKQPLKVTNLGVPEPAYSDP